jgi:hypothetical protein
MIMAGGSWTPGVDKIRAGIYTNFVEKASTRVSGTTGGVVAIALITYSGIAQPNTIYEFKATDGNEVLLTTLGTDGAAVIKLAFLGGATTVLVYTVGKTNGTDPNYEAAFSSLNTRAFDVFAFSAPVPDSVLTSAVAWVKSNREEVGKHYLAVFGGDATADADPTKGNARSTLVKDRYSVNLIVGGVIDDVTYPSGALAPYMAGIIASTPLNQSITYMTTALTAVNVRLTPAQINTALSAGSLVLTDNDDGTIIIERGITTEIDSIVAGSNKIRKVRTNIAIVTDISASANASWIGKVNNNPDGQATVIGGVKSYLNELVKSNVLFADPLEVSLDPDHPSDGDQMFLFLRYKEVDSAEEIYLTIAAGV